MTISEINAAIQAIRGANQLHEDGQGLVFHSENTLKIMLGLALCFQDEDKFKSIASHLGNQIEPFSANFLQARTYQKKTQALLIMTLKATLLANAIKGADTVIWFAKDHNYNLAVDDEVVWYIVSQRQAGRPMEGNYNIPKMLIVQEIAY